MKNFKTIVGLLFLIISSITFAIQPSYALDAGSWTGGNGAATNTTNGFTANGGISETGSLIVTQLSTPAAPTKKSGFTAGTTDYYFCMDGDFNGGNPAQAGAQGLSAPTAVGTGTTGAVGTMTCPGQTGALHHYLLRYTASALPIPASVPTQGSYLVGSCSVASGQSCDISDNNNALTAATLPPGNDTGFIVGDSIIGLCPDGRDDCFFSNCPAGSLGNAFTFQQNSSAVAAIQCDGSFAPHAVKWNFGTDVGEVNGPRSTFHGEWPSNPDVAGSQFGYVQFPVGITIKGMQCQSVAATPAGCSTSPIFAVYNNGTQLTDTNCTIANASTLCGTVSSNDDITGGNPLLIKIVTAEAGCSTKANFISCNVTYVTK